MKELSKKTLNTLKVMQKSEINEYYIYEKIAKNVKSDADREVLYKISREEYQHAKIWAGYTKIEMKPEMLKVKFFTFLSKIFGYTFTLKLMENAEINADETYTSLIDEVPEAARIAQDEERHEKALLNLLDEERLQYVGSMVLGMNDALVELTGTLAGLTFALQNNRLVALSGLITGVSATLSMTASSYLSAKSDNDPKALKSATYTGIMYLVTVALISFPYLVMPEHAYVPALLMLLGMVTLIILVFNYYISVAKGYNFKQRFFEMFFISGSVAAISFLIGLLIKNWLGINI